MLFRFKVAVGLIAIGLLTASLGCPGSSKEAKIPKQTIELRPDQVPKAAGPEVGKKGVTPSGPQRAAD